MASLSGPRTISGLDRLIAQYFELVDLKDCAIPPSHILKNPAVQKRIYDEMFNNDLLSPIIPPAAYRLKFLKEIISRIEHDQNWDPEEDVCFYSQLVLFP